MAKAPKKPINDSEAQTINPGSTLKKTPYIFKELFQEPKNDSPNYFKIDK